MCAFFIDLLTTKTLNSKIHVNYNGETSNKSNVKVNDNCIEYHAYRNFKKHTYNRQSIKFKMRLKIKEITKTTWCSSVAIYEQINQLAKLCCLTTLNYAADFF